MESSGARIFTLSEANRAVPEIARITAEVVELLESIRTQYQAEGRLEEGLVPESVIRNLEAALKSWSEKIIGTGAQPKGYFTVDFATADPEMLYCWTYGEERISYTHKVWENFSHRRPLAQAGEPHHLRWVN